VTDKFKSNGRVRKLVRGITQWSPTSSPGREVAPVPEPVEFVRPLAQYAVRTPSKEQASGYYRTVVFTSRTDPSMIPVVDHSDGRAGIEADLKGDKYELGLATIRKHRLHTQMMIVLLMRARSQGLAVGASVVERGGSPPAWLRHHPVDWAGLGHSRTTQAHRSSGSAHSAPTRTSQSTRCLQGLSTLASSASSGKAGVLE
jgi:hypothetical protein